MKKEVIAYEMIRLQRSIHRLEVEYRLGAPNIIIKNELEIIKKIADILEKQLDK